MMRGRAFIGVLLVLAILGTLGLQGVARTKREQLVGQRQAASRLSGIDTFALGLILGGLRGPLVMILWSDTENQKHEKRLEDIDTKIELIRMLQPEFDSVHIFQMWNKAYNLSVQMASLPNKYATILDAVDYGRSVDGERPDNINILASLGDLYFNKLGSSAEREYYRNHVREETLRSGRSRRLQKGEAGWKRTRHDVMLDERGMLLPEHVRTRTSIAPRATTGKSKGEVYDGSELQFLKRFEQSGGFPYGLSPLALGYNYLKRANLLAINAVQKHLHLSDTVIDSRPAIALRTWAEEEWERGRRAEIQAMGKAVPKERNDLEGVTAGLGAEGRFTDSSEKTRKLVEEALFSYQRAVEVAREADREYRRHVEQHSENAMIYASHLLTMEAMSALLEGDRNYLAAQAAGGGLVPLSAGSPEASALRARAAQQYQKAVDAYYLLILKYFTDEELAVAVFPEMTRKLAGRSIDRASIQTADPKIYPALHQAVEDYMARQKQPYYSPNASDVAEYEANISRAQQRLAQLKN